MQDDEELAAMQEEPVVMQDDVSIRGDLCGERYWESRLIDPGAEHSPLYKIKRKNSLDKEKTIH